MHSTPFRDQLVCAQPAAGYQPGVLPRQLNPRIKGT
jgi:hypothetical protein